MVLMTDPSAVSLCGMQPASLLLLWHKHTNTHTLQSYIVPRSKPLVELCQDELSFKVICYYSKPKDFQQTLLDASES